MATQGMELGVWRQMVESLTTWLPLHVWIVEGRGQVIVYVKKSTLGCLGMFKVLEESYLVIVLEYFLDPWSEFRSKNT